MTAREEALQAAADARQRHHDREQPPRLQCRAVSRFGSRCTADAADGWSELPLCARHGSMVIRSFADLGIVRLTGEGATS